MTTVAAALREAAARLAAVSPSARLDAELLMAHALGITRSDMLLRAMTDDAPADFAGLLARRAAGQPVAHILGEQEFYGLALRVTPDVLIPRPDSEILIDAAVNAFPTPPRAILDCGTGSGALLLAALSVWPDAHGVGIERSPAALAVAGDNAMRTGMADRARMIAGDWTVPGWADALGTGFDLILANPPYIADGDADLAEDVRLHEPAVALFAGEDGLADYRLLIPCIAGLLRPQGRAFVEIGMRQADSVAQIAQEAGLRHRLHRDLGGRPRALQLWIARD